jgi:hypothetical protein
MVSQDQTDLKAFMPEGWQGKYPPCQISVDKDGNLYGKGAPLIHPAIRGDVFASVVYEDGIYVLRQDGKTCQLEVEDTFFVVRLAEKQGDRVILTLNDGEREELDPSSLYLGADQVFYCRVKQGRFPARFLRPAYYQLADLVVAEGEGFSLELAGRRYPLKNQG